MNDISNIYTHFSQGLVVANLKVEILKEGSHSGHASGIVPDTFRIARMLLSRLEDEQTGRIIPSELYCDIPPQRLTQQAACAKALGRRVKSLTYIFKGNHIYEEFSFVSGSGPVHKDVTELLINRTWKPTLVVTGKGLGMCWEC
jgi:hypothetical protein